MTLKAASKILLPLTLLLTPTSALVSVQYKSYDTTDCTDYLVGSATVVSGYCVNIEDFPLKSYTAHVASGVCDDASQTPVFELYGEPGCGEGLLDSVAVDAEEKCFGRDATVRSLSVVCV